jgi:hypothetical protein
MSTCCGDERDDVAQEVIKSGANAKGIAVVNVVKLGDLVII